MSANVNTHEMLTYVISVLEEHGITYLDTKDFTEAKNNKGTPNKMLKFLFDMAVLHMLDFEMPVNVLELRGNEDDMKTLILAHLCQMQCPYLNEMEEECVGFNFDSTCSMLICSAWLMAVGDIFGRFEEKVIQRAIKESTEEEPTDKKEEQVKKNIVDFRQQPESISGLYKSLQSRLNSIANLKKKQQKLTTKLTKLLPNHNINELLSGTEQQMSRRRDQKLQKVAELIEKQIKFMRYRKIFWAWMESVLKTDKAQYGDKDQYGFDDDPKEIIGRLTVDPEKLENFISCYHQVQQLYNKYSHHFEKVQARWQERESKMTDKERKDSLPHMKRIMMDNNDRFPPFKPGTENKVNSFAAIQLKNMIFEDEEPSEVEDQDKEDHFVKQRERLEELCRQNVRNLKDYKFL